MSSRFTPQIPVQYEVWTTHKTIAGPVDHLYFDGASAFTGLG